MSHAIRKIESQLEAPVDGRQSEMALAIARGTMRLLHAHGFSVVSELPLASGRRADLVAIGRGHLVDPSLTLRAAAWYGIDMSVAPQYALGYRAQLSLARRERQELADLRQRARPLGGQMADK